MSDARDLRARIAEMPIEQRALLEQRLLAMAAPREKSPSIPRRPSDGSCPLSFAQQRLWFLERLVPGGAVYHVPKAYRVRGALDVGALEGALTGVVERHEVLRTGIVEEGGEPRQRVQAAERVRVRVVDLMGVAEGAREGECQRVLAEEARRPFDVTRDVMLRALVVRVGVEEHVLLLVLHHIATDGWSTGVLCRELSVLYQAEVEGRPAELPALPIQYADYAVWQRGQEERLRAELAYWRERLAGAPAVLELPTDRPRPAVQGHGGAERRRVLPRALAEGARGLARGERATLFMVLLAGFKAVLYRYSGQEDVVVGTAVAGRTRLETEGLIGFFVNTLALRTDCAGEPTFRELVGRVRGVALEAYGHQEVPFERLVEELRPERSLGWAPVVQVMFVLQEADRAPLQLSGLAVSPVRVGTGTAKFDLSMSVTEGPEGLEVQLEYDTALFEGATIERLLGHYERLLAGAVAAPETPISRLALLTEEERQRLGDWCGSATRFPEDTTLTRRFEQQVRRTPGAVAVTFETAHLTYAELNARANRLASYLRCRGVGRGTLVGICLERSVDLVVAIVGVVKAGGAYVPLDPNYPPGRLAFMVEDAGMALVLTHSSIADRLPCPDSMLIGLDRVRPTIEAEASEDPADESTPGDLAYVIYTSGSTGNPKGVCITHHNVVRLFQATDPLFRFSPGDVWTLFHSFAFDFSVWEFWGALLHGGRLVVVPYLVSRSPEEFRTLLSAEGVTVLNQTPSAFRQLMEADAVSSDPLGLRLVIFGGEALELPSLGPWIERHGDARPELFNMYGITETTVHVTYHRIRADEVRESWGSPIGRPLSDLRAYVLDRYRQLVPIGVPGELYVGGAGVGRGYLRRPELTAERFVEDPDAHLAGARLYRSGDLVRYRVDGTLHFLGRIDHQIKLRGHRIELGEIEATLMRQPGVSEAVTVVRGEDDGRLVAYVVPSADGRVIPAELRAALERTLPEYMVPSAFVALARLPLTANGKVDRRALPAPANVDITHGEGFVAPRAPIEAILAEIWAEVLGLERVGVHDNFFALGGHSLRAVQVVARARSVLGTELPVRVVFERPTVAGLAEAVAAVSGAAARDVSPIVPRPRDECLPLSFAQQRLWFLERLVPGGAVYHVPQAYRVRGALDVGALERALTGVVARHEVLRTGIVEEGGEARQQVQAAERVRVRVVDLMGVAEGAREGECQRVLEEEARRPFDLTREVMLRALVVRVGVEEHVLLLVLHHIATDGWSTGVLCRELSVLYGAEVEGRRAELPALPIQYADYAVWQRERLHGPRLEQALDYWRQRLEGLSDLELPTDRPRPPTPSYRGASQPVFIPARLSETLQRLGRAQQCTLFMTLLAAFAVLLRRYSGQSDVAVGTQIAGRNHSQLEGLIGFFVNTLVLRTDTSGNPSFLEVLGQARESALDAYAHQEVPFERLVEHFKPQRDPGRNPLVQVMFVLQNAPGSELSLPGVSCSRVLLNTATAKFDLTLSLSEHADGLHGQLEYATDLFESDTMARMVGHFQVLLEAIVADPTRPISELPLLTAAERGQMLIQWNDTGTEYPRDLCVHELIEAQVDRDPEATAVGVGDQQVSYRELNRRANQLAHHLRTLGVGPEVRVGICVDRSLELVVALLGILKAGGAYVPLDSGSPKRRLAFMLEDTRPAVLLTHSRLQPTLPQHTPACLYLDRDWPVIAAQPDSNPMPLARPHNLAYLMYTSGSTGTPKAVMVTHQAITRLVCNTDYVQLNARDVVAQVSNASFDAMTFEVWGAWAAGARLEIVPSGVLLSPYRLAEELRRKQITVLFLTTALFNEVVRTHPAALATVKHVLFGGEATDPRRVREALATTAPERLLHVYGPTESTTFATWQLVTAVDEAARTVPIGRPLANTRAYVLDPNMQPLPIGVPGELYLGGDGLARGYWNRPELTAEKFVADPFNAARGARLYRTGDRVRWRRDGSLEFLGRTDHQVKIRGFRIEPGEIETLLARQPGVQQALVMVREDVPGDKRLVAYVVGVSPESESLRQHLSEHLPEYMLPSAIVPLPALPLTANGKVDRLSLPAPRIGSGQAPQGWTAPRTTMELHLSKIWEDLLGRSDIGLTDSFFDLGGHSLLALQLVDRIEKTFGHRLPLDTLWFHTTTIAALADLLQGRKYAARRPDLVLIKDGSRRPLFVVHTMGGNLFHYYDLARQLEADQAVLGLQARGVYADGVPDRSIPMIAAHCIEALRLAQPKGPYLIAGFSSGGPVAYEIAQQLSAGGDSVAMLALLDAFAPHTRTRGGWVRDSRLLPGRSGFRELQERLYFLWLHPFGLGGLRTLRTAGEAHRWAHWSYRPRPYIGVVDLFLTEESEAACSERALGWQRIGAGHLRIHRLPGSHRTLMKPPGVVRLARDLQACLDLAGRE